MSEGSGFLVSTYAWGNTQFFMLTYEVFWMNCLFYKKSNVIEF